METHLPERTADTRNRRTLAPPQAHFRAIVVRYRDGKATEPCDVAKTYLVKGTLNLDDLDFSQLAFEVRFAHCYLFWDRAGRIWKETTYLFPGLTVVSAQPNHIVMREAAIDITVEPNRFHVSIFDEDRLKEIPRLAAEFAKIVLSNLEIQELSRVGLRLIHAKIFPEKESAADAVVKVGLLNIPEGKQLGVAGSVIRPEAAYSREEKGNGFSVRLKAESIEYKLDLTPLWRKVAKSINETREQLTFDVDSYLQGTILLSQIAFEDWINQSLHAIRRDSGAFLG